MKRTVVTTAAIAAFTAWITTNAPQPAPKVRTLTEQEVADLLVGSSIQGTRNGDSARMIATAKQLMAQGKTFTMVAADDLPDDWMVVAAAGGVGGGGAWEYVTDRIKQQNLPEENTRLRVGVKGGGCSGFSYLLDLTEEPKGDADEELESHGVKILCDMKSYLYLNGVEIDFKDEVMGRGFVFKNPNATSTCGCGSSFSA